MQNAQDPEGDDDRMLESDERSDNLEYHESRKPGASDECADALRVLAYCVFKLN